MDYEKRCNELIDAIKELMEANPHDEGLQNWVRDNVPELAESEDEKIRKALLELFSNVDKKDWRGIPNEKIVDWLERQGGQKQWKPSNEQIDALEHFVRSMGESGYASPYDNDTKLIYSLLEQLKQL
jgi:hypothetical protein